MNKIFIIAEAGVNHNGNLEIAKNMIDVAKDAGADAVKFQTFKAENLVTKAAQKAEYQKCTADKTESQFTMLKKLELSREAHKQLLVHCSKKQIIFLSSPFDFEGIDLLNELEVKIFKIPSGEITNLPYLRKIGGLQKKIIMSTGMADMEEIKAAFNIIVDSGTPQKDITLMHCTAEYPALMEDVNLLAMLTLKKTFDINVGYSDHTIGIEVPIAAVALGAVVIEKHFTLDKTMKGPDHQASLDPAELRTMVKTIRNIEKAMGTNVKKPSTPEIKNRMAVRKSIVAAKHIKKGDVFTDKNITVKRPGAGISPMEWDKIIGQEAKRNFDEDEMIEV